MVKHTFALPLLALAFTSQSLYSHTADISSPAGKVRVTSPVGTIRIQGKKNYSSSVEVVSEVGKLPTDCCTIHSSQGGSPASFIFEGPLVNTDASLDVYPPRNARIEARTSSGNIYISGCTHLEHAIASQGNITIDLNSVAGDLTATHKVEDKEACVLTAPCGTITFILPENTEIHTLAEDPYEDGVSFFFGKRKFASFAKLILLRKPITTDDGHTMTETRRIFPK
jgi:type 1 fimbria pilin